MDACTKFLEVESQAKGDKVTAPTIVAFAEALFFLWVGLFASLTLIASLVLAIIGVMSVMNLIYVYVGISVITVLLAVLLYYARGKTAA